MPNPLKSLHLIAIIIQLYYVLFLSVFPLCYQFYDMMRDYKRRPMVFGYNSKIAPHRYPILYSGKIEVNWETLKSIPAHNSNAANMGVSWWSHDIGGYYKGFYEFETHRNTMPKQRLPTM